MTWALCPKEPSTPPLVKGRGFMTHGSKWLHMPHEPWSKPDIKPSSRELREISFTDSADIEPYDPEQPASLRPYTRDN